MMKAQLLARLASLLGVQSDDSGEATPLAVFASVQTVALSVDDINDIDTSNNTAPFQPIIDQIDAIPLDHWREINTALTTLGSDDGDNDSDSSSGNVWSLISDSGVHGRHIVTALTAYTGSSTHRLSSPLSSTILSFYFRLLSLPTVTVSLYNEVLVHRAIGVVGRWATRARKAVSDAADNAKRPKRQGRGKTAMALDDGNSDSESDEASDSINSQSATNDDIASLLQSMLSFLIHSTVSLSDDSRQSLIDCAVEVTRTQDTAVLPQSLCAMTAYRILTALAHSRHYDTVTVYRNMLAALLPNLVMVGGSMTGTALAKMTVCVHHSARQWLCDSVQSLAASNAEIAPSLQSSLLDCLQHACVKMPDKAEYHRVIVPTLTQLLLHAPSLTQRWLRFLSKMSRNTKVALRSLSVELTAAMLVNDTDTDSGSDGKFAKDTNVMQSLLQLLLCRASDRSPVIRAKSLTEIASILIRAADDQALQSVLMAVLAMEELSEVSTSANDSEENDSVGTSHRRRSSFFLKTPSTTSMSRQISMNDSEMELYTPHHTSRVSQSSPMPNIGLDSLLTLLHRRAADPKAVVRRAALTVLTILLTAHRDSVPVYMPSMRATDLQLLYDGCQDASMAIRRQSLSSVCQLYGVYPNDSVIQQIWLGCVLPMIDDTEMSIQERALAAINEHVIEQCRVSLTNVECDSNIDCGSVWSMLTVTGTEIRHCLCRALSTIIKKDSLPKDLVARINQLLPVTDRPGVWLLAEALSAARPQSISVKALNHAWTTITGDDTDSDSDCRYESLLKVVINVSDSVSNEQRQLMCQYLNSHLAALTMIQCPSTIKLSVTALLSLADADTGRRCVNDLLLLCEQTLQSYIVHQCELSDSVLTQCLFLIGELTLQSRTKPRSTLLTLTQALLPQSLNVSGTSNVQLSSTVRAHAFITCGKSALCDESLAKSMIGIFIKELGCVDSGNDVVRNNILIIVSDLCRTFTSIVDPYLSTVANCLIDVNPIIRRHCLLLLTQLVQQEFVKLKTELYLKFLYCQFDSDAAIAALCRTLVRSAAQMQARSAGSFIECLFYYNGCVSHPVYQSIIIANHPTHRHGQHPFVLANTENRRQLYSELLTSMNDEQKLLIQSKLCEEVLGACVDKTMPINSNSHGVIADCFWILNSDTCKLSSRMSNGASTSEDNDNDGDDDISSSQSSTAASASKATDSLSVAKGKLLTKLAKKSVLEAIVPICMALKRQLHSHRSPLIKDLMDYLRTIWREHKTEMTEILAQDRQLKVEFEYDLKHSAVENERRKRKQSVGGGGEESQLSLTSVSVPVSQLSAVSAASITPMKVSTAVAQTPQRAPATTSSDSLAPFVSPRLKRSSPQTVASPLPLSASTQPTSAQKLISASKLRRVSAGPVPGCNASWPSLSAIADVDDDDNEAENVAPVTVNFSTANISSTTGQSWSLDSDKIRESVAANQDAEQQEVQESLKGMTLRKRKQIHSDVFFSEVAKATRVQPKRSTRTTKA